MFLIRGFFFTVTLAVFSLTVLASNASAQDSTLIPSNRAHWNGRWAMQFAVTDLQLTSFDGATLSLRKHLGLRPALRMGLSVADISHDEWEDSDPGSYLRESNSVTVSLSLEYLHYLNLTSPVNAFLSMGPGGGYHWRETDNGPSRSEEDSWMATFGLGLGVEWFVHKQISISGEYRSHFYYQDMTRTLSQSGLTNTVSSTRLGFQSAGVRAGIAILI